MNNTTVGINEAQCKLCCHNDICALKETYMSILDAISNATIDQPCADGKKVHPKKIIDFNFIDNISVVCRYYQNWTSLYRQTSPVYDAWKG